VHHPNNERQSHRPGRLRAIALGLVAVAMAFAVTACGSSSNDSGSSSSTTAASGGAATTAAKKKRVLFVLPSLGNQAYTRELAGAKAQAAKDPSIDLVVVAPGTGVGQADTLIPKIQNALVQGVDAMVVNGGAASPSLVSVLKGATDKGAKLVTFDVEIPQLPTVSFVNLDDDYTSALGGKFVQEQLPEGGELGLFACYPSNPVTIARVQGFYQGLKGWKGWNGKPVASADSKCDSAKARTQMENMLTAHPNLKAVYSTTDQDAVGIQQALTAAKKDIVVVAHDASKEAAQAIAKGDVLDADVSNPFEEIGAAAVKAGSDALAGKPVEKKLLLKSILVTKANAQEYADKLK
jgi:ribose transport system substrate-binding protein